MGKVSYDVERDFGRIDLTAADGAAIEQCIQFQHGPVGENGINGVQNEDVLLLVRTRLAALNAGLFPCRENSFAITKIDEAILWLQNRTALRVEQGVEGKDEAHVS